jgi:hypothetical protein
MSRLWSRWLRWLELRESAEALALCRIMAGIGFVASVSFAWHHETWRLLWLDASHGGYRTLEGGPWLIRWLGGPRPEVVGPVMAVAWLAGCSLAAGFGSRWSAGVGLILFNSLIRINVHDGSAYDSLLTNQLFLLIWADSGATWSVDSRLRHGKWSRLSEVPAWPRQVMIVQLVLCYASTGLQKLGAHWLPGGDLTAVHYILQDPFWRRWDLDRWLPSVVWLTRLATAFTWWFEVMAPLLLVALWFRGTPDRPGWLRKWSNRIDYRRCFAIAGVGLHLGLHVLMRIGPFSWIILAYYPALWSGGEVRQGFARWWKGTMS